MNFVSPNFFMYIFLVLGILYLIISAYIRIKLKFWNTQPVFHIYNLKYWLRPPGIISTEPPAVNKYVNLVNNRLIKVETEHTTGSSTAEIEIKRICNFIKDNYIIHQAARYEPSVEDIMAYLQCSNQPAFFNIYQEPKLLFEKGTLTGTTEEEIISVISARCLNLSFLKKGNKIKTCQLYYIDNLCVKSEYRKKGIAPQVIQTLHYNISRINPKVNIYMFKREGELVAIVPLVCYDTHCFDISHFNETSLTTILNPALTCIEITVNQLNLLINFINEQMKNFECVILPDVSNIMNLLKLEKLQIYGILFNGELIAVYVFRPLELYYAEKKTIECIGIIANSAWKENEVLITGFNLSLLKVKTRNKVDIILMEETANSQVVIKAMYAQPQIIFKFKNPTAFFLFNYACYSIENYKTLLIY